MFKRPPGSYLFNALNKSCWLCNPQIYIILTKKKYLESIILGAVGLAGWRCFGGSLGATRFSFYHLFAATSLHMERFNPLSQKYFGFKEATPEEIQEAAEYTKYEGSFQYCVPKTARDENY